MSLRALRLTVLVAFGALVGPEARLRADEEHARIDVAVEGDSAIAQSKKNESGSAPAKKPSKGDTERAPDAPKKGADKSAGTKEARTKDGSHKKSEPAPLPGKTIDFEYDAKDIKTPSRAYMGRVFVHDRAAEAKKPLPLVVFIHGLNKAKIKFRWMGGGEEGDVRRIVADLIDDGKVQPVLLAAPSSIQPDAVATGSSFPIFDFDQFLALTEKSLDGVATIDKTRIIVAGHSGAGCSSNGGIVAAARAKTVPYSVISIDTCMHVDLAKALGAASPTTHVVVTWQTVSWDRSFDAFTTTFKETLAQNPAAEGVMRELDPLPALPKAHDATVGQTFSKYLPKLLP